MKRRPRAQRLFDASELGLRLKARKCARSFVRKFSDPAVTFQGEVRGTKAAAMAAIEEAKRRG